MDKSTYRYRIRFAKMDAMRFTSHLDLHRSLERTFRRAQLPLAYSQGFNPRPRINLGSALPLGMTGECELVDIWLTENRTTQELRTAIGQAAPPGIAFIDIEPIDLQSPNLQSLIVSSIYLVQFEDGPSHDQLQSKVDKLMGAASLPRTRRGKSYDLRPLVEGLEVLAEAQETCTLKMTLSAREGATGRADEVLQALGYDPGRANIVRTKLLL